jgi:hypothetical protein
MSKQRKSNKEIKKPKADSNADKKHKQAAKKDDGSITQLFDKT